MLRPHSPTMREGPTPCKGWAHLQGGQRSVSLEYQTCTSAYLFDTLVTGKALVSQPRLSKPLDPLTQIRLLGVKGQGQGSYVEYGL